MVVKQSLVNHLHQQSLRAVPTGNGSHLALTLADIDPAVHNYEVQDRSLVRAERFQQALVVLTMIRVMAYTLMMVFYHRQVRSHCRKAPPSFCEVARSLELAFFTPGADTG